MGPMSDRRSAVFPAGLAQQVQLAALSANGALIYAKGSGHLIHVERPNLVVEAVLDVVLESRRATTQEGAGKAKPGWMGNESTSIRRRFRNGKSPSQLESTRHVHFRA